MSIIAVSKIKALSLMILVLTVASIAQAQEKGQGEIESVQFEIVTEKKIVLPQANRNFEKVAPRPVEPIKPEITYEFKNLSFRTSEFNPIIRPMRLQNESLAKLYNNYISAGFGNFASPFLSAHLTSKRDRKKFLGASVFHRSFGSGAVDDAYSGSGNSQLRLFGNSFGKAVTLGGFVDYENSNTYFYGYSAKPVQRSTIRQAYSVFSLGGNVKNSESGDVNYEFETGFSFLNDHLKAKESEVKFDLTTDYAISRSGKLIVNADYYLIARKDEFREAKPRHLLRSMIGYRWSPLDKLDVTVGGKVAFENDTLAKDNALHVYPHVNVSYDLGRTLEAFVTVTGDIDRVSLHTLSRENVWVQSNLDIFHTNRTAEFLAGLRGSLGNKVSFHTGVSLANLKNLYFYQNDPSDASRFKTYYDRDNTTRTNVFAEVGLMQATKLRISARGDFYGYNTDIIKDVVRNSSFASAVPSQNDVALHRPTYRLKGDFSYNVYDKIVLSIGVVTQGGMRAIDFTQSTPAVLKVVDIKPAVDLNVGADYLVSKQFSLFVKLNNVLANEYELYLRYPVRGFQALAGASWSF